MMTSESTRWVEWGRGVAWRGCLMKLRSPSLLHSIARHRSQLKFTPLKRVELAVPDWQCSGYNLQETYSLGRLRLVSGEQVSLWQRRDGGTRYSSLPQKLLARFYEQSYCVSCCISIESVRNPTHDITSVNPGRKGRHFGYKYAEAQHLGTSVLRGLSDWISVIHVQKEITNGLDKAPAESVARRGWREAWKQAGLGTGKILKLVVGSFGTVYHSFERSYNSGSLLRYTGI
jgi:hypothetical protein